jgi:hypothetical protein
MNKLLHRTISFGFPFIIFFGVIAFTMKGGLSFFLAFLIIGVLSVAFIFSFIKIPMKCDQLNCVGIANIEVSEEVKDTFLRHIIVKGHRCNNCNHLIELPKGPRH